MKTPKVYVGARWRDAPPLNHTLTPLIRSPHMQAQTIPQVGICITL